MFQVSIPCYPDMQWHVLGVGWIRGCGWGMGKLQIRRHVWILLHRRVARSHLPPPPPPPPYHPTLTNTHNTPSTTTTTMPKPEVCRSDQRQTLTCHRLFASFYLFAFYFFISFFFVCVFLSFALTDMSWSYCYDMMCFS